MQSCSFLSVLFTAEYKSEITHVVVGKEMQGFCLTQSDSMSLVFIFAIPRSEIEMN